MTAPLSQLTVFRRRYCRPDGSATYTGLAVRAGGSSGPAAQWPIRSRALLIVSEARLIVGKEDLGNKITPGTPVLVNTFLRCPCGVHRDHETVSDLDGRETLQDESGQVAAPVESAHRPTSIAGQSDLGARARR